MPTNFEDCRPKKMKWKQSNAATGPRRTYEVGFGFIHDTPSRLSCVSHQWQDVQLNWPRREPTARASKKAPKGIPDLRWRTQGGSSRAAEPCTWKVSGASKTLQSIWRENVFENNIIYVKKNENKLVNTSTLQLPKTLLQSRLLL